jgi:hypothetical protein
MLNVGDYVRATAPCPKNPTKDYEVACGHILEIGAGLLVLRQMDKSKIRLSLGEVCLEPTAASVHATNLKFAR